MAWLQPERTLFEGADSRSLVPKLAPAGQKECPVHIWCITDVPFVYCLPTEDWEFHTIESLLHHKRALKASCLQDRVCRQISSRRKCIEVRCKHFNFQLRYLRLAPNRWEGKHIAKGAYIAFSIVARLTQTGSMVTTFRQRYALFWYRATSKYINFE